MKQLTLIGCVLIVFILASCASNEEPDYPVFMQPLSIQSMDANGDNQTFEYDDYGRIVSWKCIANNSNASTSYSVHYYYPDENTIKVTAEELWLNQQRSFEETIQLKNGRASKSEGSFIFMVDGNQQLRKTYRLEFTYLPTNHLNSVKHSEVVGIDGDIKNSAWDNAWTWENHLIWENGNLKEFQDYQGNSMIYQTTKYEYSEDKVAYPIIFPMVINNAHHLPLSMQGVFGLNSVNLLKSASLSDNNDNPYLSREYTYKFEEERVREYTETLFTNSAFATPTTYKVTWTEQ